MEKYSKIFSGLKLVLFNMKGLTNLIGSDFIGV